MTYSEDYLNNLINDHVEENIHLDYKAAGALDKTNLNKTKDSISKDVAAFANANGGVLIYGLKEDKTNKHLVNAIEPIDRSHISKEWLEQIIQSSIQPRIDNIQIHPIEIGGDKQKVVYIVDVPQSNTAHQSNDQRYYRRHNFNNLPMHDYEIRDVMNRVKHPRIIIEIEMAQYPQDDIDQYYLKVFAKNTGVVLAKYIHCVLSIPTDSLLMDLDMEPIWGKRWNLSIDNTFRDLITRNNGGEYGPKRYQPLLPQVKLKLSHQKVVFNKNFKKYEIKWSMNADNADPVSGVIKLKNVLVYDDI
jgi:hypothetical protein